MKAKNFKIEDFLQSEETYFVQRTTMSSSGDISAHQHHNYCEMFMVESGKGFQCINKQRVALEKGTLCMIRPQDVHYFMPDPKEKLSIVNIAFDIKTLNFFKSRYFPTSHSFFWSESIVPFHIVLPPVIRKRISLRITEAINSDRSNLQLDSLFLFIFRTLEKFYSAQTPQTNAHDWLNIAISQYNNPREFMGGTERFIQLCNRSVAYVNQSIKKHFNMTTTDLMNLHKLNYAQNQLIMTSMPIKEICHNCGFSSIGYFYKIFKARYGTSPVEFRRMNQSMM